MYAPGPCIIYYPFFDLKTSAWALHIAMQNCMKFLCEYRAQDQILEYIHLTCFSMLQATTYGDGQTNDRIALINIERAADFHGFYTRVVCKLRLAVGLLINDINNPSLESSGLRAFPVR